MKIQWTTLIAFCVTVVAVTTLTALKLEVPAALAAAVGALLSALLPAMLAKPSSGEETKP